MDKFCNKDCGDNSVFFRILVLPDFNFQGVYKLKMSSDIVVIMSRSPTRPMDIST